MRVAERSQGKLRETVPAGWPYHACQTRTLRFFAHPHPMRSKQHAAMPAGGGHATTTDDYSLICGVSSNFLASDRRYFSISEV